MKKDFENKVHRIDKKVDKMRMRRKDSDDTKVKENVFDTQTLKTLYTLSSKGIIQAMGGSISTGKEANVFIADGEEKEIAVKIYRITSSTFRAMEDYIIGDPRFNNIRHTKKDIVFAWTRKELRNLTRAQNAGIRVPTPIIAERNILVMEFMGKDEQPYPILKEIRLEKEEAQRIFDKIIEYIDTLYRDANLVHGDLSEYNIMIDPDNMEPIIIDMGQSTTLEHLRARDFLRRDIQNITRFFKKYGISADPEEIYQSVQKEQEE